MIGYDISRRPSTCMCRKTSWNTNTPNKLANTFLRAMVICIRHNIIIIASSLNFDNSFTKRFFTTYVILLKSWSSVTGLFSLETLHRCYHFQSCYKNSINLFQSGISFLCSHFTKLLSYYIISALCFQPENSCELFEAHKGMTWFNCLAKQFQSAIKSPKWMKHHLRMKKVAKSVLNN